MKLNIALGIATFAIAHVAFSANPDLPIGKVCDPSLIDQDGVETTVPSVYLYKGGKRHYYTYEVDSASNGMIRRDVTFGEITSLCNEGIGISLLADTTETNQNAQSQLALATAAAASLPISFSIIRRTGNVYGNLTASGSRPAGMTTQWSSFNFKSVGYPASEHVAFVHFVDAVLESQGNLVGNGFTIGNISQHPSGNGCGGTNWPNVPAYNTQVESFWVGGNALWGNTCAQNPNGLVNGTTYSFVLHANTGEWVSYSRAGIPAPPAVYTGDVNPNWNPDNGGIRIGSTNFSPFQSNFTLTFTQVNTGWF